MSKRAAYGGALVFCMHLLPLQVHFHDQILPIAPAKLRRHTDGAIAMRITFPASSPKSVLSNCPVIMSWNKPTLQTLSSIFGRKSRNRKSRKSMSTSLLPQLRNTLICSSLTLLFSGSLWRKFISPRACLKHVNMPNRRVFCPLDGASFPCNPPGFLRKNCLPAAQNPSLPDTSPIFKQALVLRQVRTCRLDFERNFRRTRQRTQVG